MRSIAASKTVAVQVATVAAARKMTVLCWHLIAKNDDYAFARPSLNAHKLRKRELAAGAASRRGPIRGATHEYHVKHLRDQENALVEQEEHAYEVLVAHWQPQRPQRRVDNLIRRVDDLARLDRELEERHELRPTVPARSKRMV